MRSCTFAALVLIAVLTPTLRADKPASIFDSALDRPEGRAGIRDVPDRTRIAEAQRKLLTRFPIGPNEARAQRERFDALNKAIDDTPTDDAMRYAILDARRDLAAGAGWVADALACCEVMRKKFHLDEPSVLQQTVHTLNPQVDADVQACLDVLFPAFDRSSRLGSADANLAPRLIETLRGLAGRLKEPRVSAEARQKLARSEVRLVAWRKARDAQISESPSPAQRTLIGSYLCFYEEDWSKGVRYLADCDDAVLRQVAKLDQSKLSAPQTGVQVGDAWWDLAAAPTRAPEAPEMRRRAAFWYAASLSTLDAKRKAEVRQRIVDATGVPGAPEKKDLEPASPGVVLVLDGTGTMVGLKFQLLKREVKRFLDNAPQDLRVGMVIFLNGDVNDVATPSKELVLNTPENGQKLSEFIEQVGPGGSTNPLAALETAFAMKPTQVIMLTDGEFDNLVSYQEVTHKINLLNAAQKVRVDTIMFGQRDPRAEDVLKQIASDNKGQMQYVSIDQLLK